MSWGWVGSAAVSVVGNAVSSNSAKANKAKNQGQSFGDVENGLNFGTSGTWANQDRNIEGMSTQTVNRNVSQIGANYQKQFDLGAAMLQPQFDASRSKVSNALASRGMGRTSTFANSMTDISGKEQMAQSSLMSNLIQAEQKDALSRSQLGANMEMAGLDSRSKRAGSRYGYAGDQMTAKGKSDESKGAGIGGLANVAGSFFSK